MYNVIYCLFDSELKPLNNDLKSIVIEPKMMDAEKSKEMAERISSIILKEKTVLQEKGECLEGFDIGGHNYLADIELIESSEGEALYQVVCYDFVKAVEKIMMVIKDRYELTKREFEAFRYLVGGFDTADIAGMMFISQATTKKHLNSIYQKLGIKGRHQLIRVMMRHGVSE